MSKLVAEIAQYIRTRMRDASSTLGDADGALRSVFHGPPIHYLREILDELESDGGLEVELPGGQLTTIPVLLPTGRSNGDGANPPVGQSGVCDDSYLLALRNTPACPRFLTLTPPAQHSILSIAQATDEFGLATENNGGSASVEDWWGDEFVQRLVSMALGRNHWRSESEERGARKLLEHAVKAANEGDRHDAQRIHGWATIARVLSISDPIVPFRVQWSLACGVPPMADDVIDEAEQTRVLKELATSIVDDGFAECTKWLKRTANEEEASAIDDCMRHLQLRCEVPLALTHAAQFYYAPFSGDLLGPAPDWWRLLTAERLAELLERESSAPAGAVTMRCSNPILQGSQGYPKVVSGEVKLELALPDDVEGPVTVTLTRDGGGKAGRREWEIELFRDPVEVRDDDLPRHRRPIRYSAEVAGMKKSTLRIVSLATWEPGVVVWSRGAIKATLPKKSRPSSAHAFECQLTMAGEGRHLLDLHLAPGIGLAERARGEGSSRGDAPAAEAVVSLPPTGSDGPAGIEVSVSAECSYDITMIREDGRNEVLRIFLSGDDEPTEGSRSEFERLIRLNGLAERGRTASIVQVDRQVRVSDLHAWALDEKAITKSFYPLVLAPDCKESWRTPDWESSEGTVLSRARFLHDPRPSIDELRPPEEFVHARTEIARRIRGEDGHGLAELTEFGSLMGDPNFVALVDQYVRAYLRWLDAEPDAAAWADLIIVCDLEADGRTLGQEPDAVLVSPLHPVRIGWHCLAQRALWEAWRAKAPCPAGSILNPDSVPDVLALPLRTASGGLKRVVFLATDCSSDYWGVLWNGARIHRLVVRDDVAPFDHEFGIQLGGVSSGFSVSQVRRALDDISELLTAKPVLNVVVSSSAGHSDACSEGLMSWARDRLADCSHDDGNGATSNYRKLQVFDERRPDARPEDAAIANLAEDTSGAVRWYSSTPATAHPDIGIIAQLETSNPAAEPSELGSPLGMGALLRHRVRTQLRAGAGAFLSESRMGIPAPPAGDSLADNTMQSIARLENLGDSRLGYTFAPNVQAIQALFDNKHAEYVALSSSAVDPACFLGGWLDGVYLWDYELPSYSHRAGDTNGYYLLTSVKPLECESLQSLLSRLPNCDTLTDDSVREILLEVARRGMPTVRGLSGGNAGASGDLGLFLAGRLLQDEFRLNGSSTSLLSVLEVSGELHQVALVVPVDPFRGYLQDIQRSLGLDEFLRPDLLVIGIAVTDSQVRCRLTPIEVKYRSDESMSPSAGNEALDQARALSRLLAKMQQAGAVSGLVMWRLAFQHLLLSMMDFGFRVYSQQLAASNNPLEWGRLHARVLGSILADEAQLEIDPTGRLIIFDASHSSAPRDLDGDAFSETIVLRPSDAASIVLENPADLYASIRRAIGDWRLWPTASREETTSLVKLLDEESVSIHGDANGPGAGEAPPFTEQPITANGGNPTPRPSSEPVNSATAAQGDAATGPSSPAHPRPASVDGIKILVGRTVDDFKSEEKFLRPSLTALNQLNMGVVGDLGTGKTQLVKSLVYQFTKSADANDGVRPRFLIFDYKKDYSAPDFVAAVGAKVVAPHQLPLNLFDISRVTGSAVPWLDRFKFFADVLDKIYSNVGPVQRENLKQAVKAAYHGSQAMGRQPTIYDVHERYRAQVQGKPDAPLSIIGDMIDMELFVADASIAIPFEQFLNGVVVISLDALGQDDRSKNMLVAIMLNMFYEHMLRIPKRPYRGTDPQLRTVDAYLLVDEADNIMRYEFDVLRKILLQGREFGVGVMLASQYLRHFKAGSTDYREPLLSWFIHKVPNVTPQELSALGLSGAAAQAADRVRQLANHHCLYKSLDVPGVIVDGVPFYRILRDEEAAR